MDKKSGAADGQAALVTCASCKACCCRLEVMLMSEDDIPAHLVTEDRWGGRSMARLSDGWCAALDRDTLLCRIYERRPAICRDFEMGGSDCLSEREKDATLATETHGSSRTKSITT